ncbi:helix-turn-helix transcriptional regulator [Bradyrhizobium sp. U87765 SZCCT0131]|uniref:helix-turn-helix transcriptional regulator n=1 Tax=unclassified Bradyrhizobium TaxID=2631580 RepID=UPI001BA7CCB2|nr:MULTISPECIES: AraC family transcriptional regulator [unclassified Bradyrhizobium]MBR1219076.1 helix-turn-helix transcriptional regulator [Bradyrhizobium sp. U87765 SZCCT0131]MBR1261727.1 helix-turn-helix transcriptional regulator [Bradyrhizobium sp. U87765 SZCCT0134]MBR1306420.1 helix-turn-helix transcriptional regulator [Bradyrhizobium sp. U87765 SZCCT0110]MBR1317509.1 helix-turn-helix transcriptional regulator [Bradyrhizobium sp. U87765 SZCCT0109]MBR1351211.1 helix-turn-helix transcriptio
MTERRFFGDAVARSLGLQDAPSLTARALRKSAIAATRISCGERQLGMTPQIPPEDTFIVALYLTRLPYHELWSGGRPLFMQGYAANAMRIVNLAGEFSARITHPHESMNFHIPRSALDAFTADAGMRRIGNLACTPGIVDPVLAHLAAALRPAFERPHEANALFVDHVTLAICAYLAGKYGDAPAARTETKGGLSAAQLRRAEELLADNCSGDLLLADVARECGLSRQYFTKAFKTTTGVTPHRWLQRYRIESAKALLRDTKLPLVDIAIRCGFADQSHFTRVFSAHAGASPAAWRRVQDDAAVGRRLA